MGHHYGWRQVKTSKNDVFNRILILTFLGRYASRMKVQEGLPYEQGGNASRTLNGVPQEVHSWSVCGTVRGLEPKKYDR